MLANSKNLPHLNTPLTEPLLLIQQHFLSRCELIEAWFQKQWQLTIPPVYGSVDLRNAGFKLAPIDMNLFPAGFNNLNPDYFSISVDAARDIITKVASDIKKILIIPESHTRNLFYWENIKTLQKILQQAGFEIRFGILADEIKTPTNIELANQEKILVEPLIRDADKLMLTDFHPDLILLNNDLSDGIPEIIQNIHQQIIPPAELGWSQRLKSGHFQYYAQVAEEFAKEFDIDPWLIAPLFRHCGKLNFMQQDGLECVIANAEALFDEIRQKYADYNIPYQPFIVVKADAGTYGMAVMTVRNVDELRNMNRKQRTRMATTKGGQTVNRVIIQEGVYSFEAIGNDKAVAEPVVYLWGSKVVGGFYRVHKERGVDENLNSPGMHFEPIAFPQPCNEPCNKSAPDASQNRLYVYGIVAQLSMLAAAREIKDQAK